MCRFLEITRSEMLLLRYLYLECISLARTFVAHARHPSRLLIPVYLMVRAFLVTGMTLRNQTTPSTFRHHCHQNI